MINTPNTLEDVIEEMGKELEMLNIKIEYLKDTYTKLYLYKQNLLQLLNKKGE